MHSQLYDQLISKKQEKVSNRKKTASSTVVLGKQDSNTQKNETGPLPYTIHKNKFKMDEKLKCETGSYQNPRGE